MENDRRKVQRFTTFIELIIKYEDKIEKCENTILKNIYIEVIRDINNLEFKTILEIMEDKENEKSKS